MPDRRIGGLYTEIFRQLRLAPARGRPASAAVALAPGRGRAPEKAEAGDPLDAVAFEAEPAWPADLPDSRLRTEVGKRLAMRVLLPVATVTGEATDLALLNEDAKTVVRLQLLTMRCDAEGIDEPRVLWPRLRLLPVKGYQRDLSELPGLSGGRDGVAGGTGMSVRRGDGRGRSRGRRLLLQAQCVAQAGPDRPRCHAQGPAPLLDTLERNIPGTRADLDSEFLHDLRVATRRTRSVLSQVKQVLPDDVVADFKQRFAWLGQVTGPTRDLDVFLLELPRYRASLPASMRGDLDGLEEHLRTAHASRAGDA